MCSRYRVTPETLGAWQQTVATMTGKAPGRWYMSGFPHIVRTLRGSLGQHRRRDPATLWKCEVCPSLVAPSVRVHMRRFIGTASATGADVACCGVPLMAMVEGTGLSRLVAESRVVLSETPMAREAAAIAAARSVVAGSAPPPAFDSVGFACGPEGIGRSSVPEMYVEFRGELRSGCIQFSAENAKASLAFQGWAMSRHEDSVAFGGVKRVLYGCDEAARGPELLELAATGAWIGSLGIELPAVSSHEDLEQGSYNDLAQVDEGEDDIPASAPPTPTPAPTMLTPLILPIPDDELPGGGPAAHPENEEDPDVFIDDGLDDGEVNPRTEQPAEDEPSRPSPPPPPSSGVPSGPYPMEDPRFPRATPEEPTVTPEEPGDADTFVDDGGGDETTQKISCRVGLSGSWYRRVPIPSVLNLFEASDH